jgi:serine/threonine protein kinase
MPNHTDWSDSSNQPPAGQQGDALNRREETPLSSLPTQPATITPAVELPAFIGPYRVIAFLGRGGQGTVFRAVHPTLGRDVVVKLASSELSPTQQESLFEEGRTLARLDDPGLIRVYDANVHDGRPYVVFEYVQGRSLADRVRGTNLPLREAVSLVAELAAILERVHRAGVLHRDLKPTNVLLDSTGKPRLMDFGSALLTAPYTDRVAEELSGTPSYMPPEQANGAQDHVGRASDVFGLGAILYHLLTGTPPYTGTSGKEVWSQARDGRVTPIAERNAAVPAALAQIIDRALAKDPAARYASSAEFARALRGYLRQRTLRLFAVFAGLVLLSAGVVAIWLWMARNEQPKPQNEQPKPQNEQPQQQSESTRTEPTPVVRELAPRPRLAGWREYHFEEGYAVLFPGKPMLEEVPPTQKNPYRKNHTTDKQTSSVYAVVTSPYRESFPTPQAAIRARRDEILSAVLARLTREREISYGEYLGAEASAFVPEGPFQGYWIRMRVYLVRDHFYAVVAAGREPHKADDIDVLWFLDSFRLLPNEPNKKP